MRRTDGLALLWVIFVALILTSVTLSMVQSVQSISRSSASVARGTLLDVREQNLLNYESRLLEANAGRVLRTLPDPAVGTMALSQNLQAQFNAWCNRDPDSLGTGRVRVYSSPSACDQALPKAVATPPTLQPGTGTTSVNFPLALVAPIGDRPGVLNATLFATYGAMSAGGYALITPGDYTFPNTLHVQGNVQVNGRLSFDTAPDVDGQLGTSGCMTPADGCQGEMAVTVKGTSLPVMALTPTAGHPLDMKGALVTATLGEVPTVPSVAGLALTANQLTLGVLGSGTQYLKACLGRVCTEYVGRPDGNLYVLSTNKLVASAWNGALTVAAPGTLQVQPSDGNAPSVARPLSVVTSSPLLVAGNLTYAQTSCSKTRCNSTGTVETLSLIAPAVTVAPDIRRLHAHVSTPLFNCGSDLTLFGSLSGTPRNAGPLYLQADRRVLDGAVPPVYGTLAARWRFPKLTFTP